MSRHAFDVERARRRLAEWLAERRMDQLLCPQHPADAVEVPSPPVRYDESPDACHVGDVVLLRRAGADWGPVYVLLLEAAGAGRWRAVPFGRYATPAVPGEWATGWRAFTLRVLCCWNMWEVDENAMLGGPVKRLSAGQLQLVQTACRTVAAGGHTAAGAGRFGPPLLHPADPRYEYLDEERRRLRDHSGREKAAGSGWTEEGPGWLMAAEGRPRYGR